MSTDSNVAVGRGGDTGHGEAGHEDADQRRRERRTYLRFAAMISASTTVMSLLTYTNVFTVAHIRFSEERVYMALLMGSAMAVVMLGFMWGSMYSNVRGNVAIVIAALLLGVGALWLSRSPAWVEDQAYMRGMIPHHSIAILTSERAQIEDLRVREPAAGIAATQRQEIAEMDWLIADITENGPATTLEDAESRPVPAFGG